MSSSDSTSEKMLYLKSNCDESNKDRSIVAIMESCFLPVGIFLMRASSTDECGDNMMGDMFEIMMFERCNSSLSELFFRNPFHL